MTKPILTLVIIAITRLLCIIDKLPFALMIAPGMLAGIFSAATTSRTAFYNFGSTSILLFFGRMKKWFSRM